MRGNRRHFTDLAERAKLFMGKMAARQVTNEFKEQRRCPPP